MQRENEKQPWFPVAFYSKGINSAQKKYSTYDRKLLAAFLVCKKFWHLLGGQKVPAEDRSLVPGPELAKGEDQ